MEQLMTIDDLSHLTADEERANQLMMKVKNTMTDRCIVNKKLVSLLEQWREMKKKWDELKDVWRKAW